MDARSDTLVVSTRGRGLHDVTDGVRDFVRSLGGVRTGIVHVWIRHTSASLVVQENADPDVLRDLDAFLTRLVPAGDALYRHTAEGPDDMPSHVRAALTQTSLAIPVVDGALALGTWQAVYVWEHRHRPHRRELVLVYLGR